MNWGYKNYLSVGHHLWLLPAVSCRPNVPWGRDLPRLGVHTVLGLHSSLSMAKSSLQSMEGFVCQYQSSQDDCSVPWFHGNTEFSCLFVGKPKPIQLSHATQSSSFEHLLFQNTTFLFHQGFQDTSCCRTLLH